MNTFTFNAVPAADDFIDACVTDNLVSTMNYLEFTVECEYWDEPYGDD